MEICGIVYWYEQKDMQRYFKIMRNESKCLCDTLDSSLLTGLLVAVREPSHRSHHMFNRASEMLNSQDLYRDVHTFYFEGEGHIKTKNKKQKQQTQIKR